MFIKKKNNNNNNKIHNDIAINTLRIIHIFYSK